jgi:hypothetical protein
MIKALLLSGDLDTILYLAARNFGNLISSFYFLFILSSGSCLVKVDIAVKFTQTPGREK